MALQEWDSVLQDTIEEHDIEDTWSIEFDDAIVPDHPAGGWQEYISGAFARFMCSKCKRTWPSKRVLVVFHMRLLAVENKGMVKVKRFRQKCKKCVPSQMEEPHFKAENIEVLLEKLVEKILVKYYDKDPGEQNKSFHFVGRIDGPHEAAHCEACQHGICRQVTTK
ncbi:receptor-transporting protein 4-like [Coregonus clupeaformis]|uniref:receptor-transporting protein 4-like n=1 Tax=Coregonus clupeaformis TaxID=59861 RepID=UPI001BE0374E|nr:receptor-transporting protein 4-like [Coregonus clupeaformis]